MKSFKQFLQEAQDKGTSDMLNVLYGNIKLNDANSKAIMPDAGIKSIFRHITDEKGIKFLVKNKDKKVAVSALKMGRTLGGIETNGHYIAVIDGTPMLWEPNDAWTFVGEDGQRWVSLLEDRHMVFPEAFRDEYYQNMWKLLTVAYPKMFNDMLEDLSPVLRGEMDTLARNMVSGKWDFSSNKYDIRQLMEEGETQNLINKYIRLHKDSKPFIKQVLKGQEMLLTKYAKPIQNYIRGEWKHAKQEPLHKPHVDEAVVENIKVIQILIRVNSGFLPIMSQTVEKELVKTGKDELSFPEMNKLFIDMDMNEEWDMLLDRLRNLRGFKGQISFFNPINQLRSAKEFMGKKLTRSTDNMLEMMGLKRDKHIWSKLT